jgi:hypothetical protein
MPARFRDNRSECGECRPIKRRRGGALIAPLLKIEALRPSEGRSTSPSPGGASRRKLFLLCNDPFHIVTLTKVRVQLSLLPTTSCLDLTSGFSFPPHKGERKTCLLTTFLDVCIWSASAP